jgi:isoaspartyl peptidase/L-asparaginase-like protein (Ntn-hydrolase superfamily)
MIHGGAGTLDGIKSDREAVHYLESIRDVLEHRRQALLQGGSALDMIEQNFTTVGAVARAIAL